jgi:hypothetical protein
MKKRPQIAQIHTDSLCWSVTLTNKICGNRWNLWILFRQEWQVSKPALQTSAIERYDVRSFCARFTFSS